MELQIEIPAKLNLSLKITGKLDNLHTLDMETLSVSLYDVVTAERTKNGISVELTGYDGLDASRYLPVINRAIEKFVTRFGEVGARLKVVKNIPLGAGLGGSSAAVAGVVKALAEFKNVRLDSDFLLTLGSDTPALYEGGHLRVTGVGDKIEKLDYVKKYFVALVPEGGVDSGQAYALYDALGSMPFGTRENDLELAARKLCPQIIDARRLLEEAGASEVLMSGSGNTVCAVFDDEEEAKNVYEKLAYAGRSYLLRSVNA